jgi:hypothetical protein
MSEVRIGQRLHLLVPGQWVPSSASLVDISPAPSLLPTGLFPKEQLQGINPPRFYLGTGFLKYQSGLLPGMSGQAKILVGRRSLAGFAGRFVRDLVQRKVW